MRARACLLAVCLFASSCGGSTPPVAPSPLSIAGTWSGVFVVGPAKGVARLTVTQTGERLSGTWTATIVDSDGGSFEGSLRSGAIELVLTSQTPGACAIALRGTATISGLDGILAPLNCGLETVGGFSFSRQ